MGSALAGVGLGVFLVAAAYGLGTQMAARHLKQNQQWWKDRSEEHRRWLAGHERRYPKHHGDEQTDRPRPWTH